MERRYHKTYKRVMAALARSDKVAKDTLKRVKAKMLQSDTSASLYTRTNMPLKFKCLREKDFSNYNVVVPDDDSEDEDIVVDDLRVDVPSKQNYQKIGYLPLLSTPLRNIDPSDCRINTFAMVSHYMDRISHQCECYWDSMPYNAMTKGDKLHCHRFHRDILPKLREKACQESKSKTTKDTTTVTSSTSSASS